MENLYDKRKSYELSQLLESDTAAEAMIQFGKWYHEAEAGADNSEVNAMSVSTMEADGCPRTRMVLLKSYSEEGLVFYTNYESKKGAALAAKPVACLHFFWPWLERQVIIKAEIKKVPAEDSDDYFRQRPKGSQLGALVSPQSHMIPNREYLSERLAALQRQYEGEVVPRPENWGGYLAMPYEIEFWQGRPNRLHDRILYTKTNGGWQKSRLAP